MAELTYTITVNIGNISQVLFNLICISGMKPIEETDQIFRVNLEEMSFHLMKIRELPPFSSEARMCNEFIGNTYDDITNMHDVWDIESVIFTKEQSCPIPQPS